MAEPVTSKNQVYRLGDPEADLFSDAMDRAVSMYHSVRHGAMRNAERAGEGSTMDGERLVRTALAAGFKAYLEEIGPDVETESKHPCDDGLRTATCPGCDGKGCDYCNEGVQLVRARQETESKPAPQCIWRTGCKNHRLCDEMGCCQQLGQQQNGKSSHP